MKNRATERRQVSAMGAKMPDKRTATSKRCLLKQTCARYVVADP